MVDEAMLSMALHLRGQELSLREIAAKLVITKGAKKGEHPSPATVMRMLREHDRQRAENGTANGVGAAAVVDYERQLTETDSAGWASA